jgi:ATP-dependent helicase HrpA
MSERAAHQALIDELRSRLDQTTLQDAPRIAATLERIAGGSRDPGRVVAALARVERDIAASIRRVEQRRSVPLILEFDPQLPISAHVQDLAAAIARHPVTIVSGETGSGKSTQLPKICLAAGRGARGLIGHTEPRRIAARALAQRIATETGTELGQTVGYQVRFTDRTAPRTRVKLMTDGILLRELEHDRELRRYDTLILDEAHERTLNIDFLLGVLRNLIRTRPELAVIITSATIDTDRFARFFDGAPVINVSGRGHPVEIRYRAAGADEDSGDDAEGSAAIVGAVHELAADCPGDILVFLPGEKEIRETADALARRGPGAFEVLPLYARLAEPDQARIFAPHSARRVILATNVAETSLTVSGVRGVIDTGLARISRYSTRLRVQRLPVEPVSRASADQRAGRCGREAAGITIRLYSEADYLAREPATPPEILRTNLASVILRMATLKLGAPEDFPFLDAPDRRYVNDGYRLLEELGAMDRDRRLSRVGRDMAALPVDPRLARMLLAAAREHCLAEMCIIAAFLAIPDPRERNPAPPLAASSGTGATVEPVDHPRSDFITVLNLHAAYATAAASSSGSALRRWCKQRSVAYLRMREWQDLTGQLREACSTIGLAIEAGDESYQRLHRAILAGFLGQIGERDERREYRSVRNARFVLAPGSAVVARPPRWIVAASLVETTRVYARMIAAVEPAWIESVAGGLVRRTYSDPEWQRAGGYVAAVETVSLYGLTLHSGRRVNYARIDAEAARLLFALHALVLGESRLDHEFLRENAALVAEVESLEARLRRRDLLMDEEQRAQFYLERLPVTVASDAAFERFARTQMRSNPRLLCMQREHVLARPVEASELDGFPDTWTSGATMLALRYRYQPGAEDDGVTMLVPIEILPALEAGDLAWTVPGLRLEKLIAKLRGLPKELRRKLVPVPDHARAALAAIDRARDFHVELSRWIELATGSAIGPAELRQIPVPEYLEPNLRVLDRDARVVAEGRRLEAVRRRLREAGQLGAAVAAGSSPEAKARHWAFGNLPEEVVRTRGDARITLYPGLEDLGDGVRRAEYATATLATAASLRGIVRLAALALPQQFKYAQQTFRDRRDLILLGAGLGLSRPAPDLLAERVFRDCFARDDEPLPRTESEFLARLERGRGDLGIEIDRTAALAEATFTTLRAIRARLAELVAPAFEPTLTDVRAQIARLIPRDFPLSLSRHRLGQVPRYLKAITHRLERVRGALERERAALARLAPYVAALETLEAEDRAQGIEWRAELVELDELIEEFRVSLFAQALGTARPISGKRLDAQLERARGALAGAQR